MSSAAARANKTTHVDKADPSEVKQAQQNLPKPETLPPSDLDSMNPNIGKGSGAIESHTGTGAGSTAGLRGPATGGSDMDMSGIGRDETKH
jgi:hypothetical protein